MPLKIRSLAIFSFLFFIHFATCYSQEFVCNNLDNSGFIDKAYTTFEKDLYTYYNFGDDPIKTYRTFLTEVASLSIDLRKLPSKESIEIARLFKKKAGSKNSIWMKLSDYENHEASIKTAPYVSSKKTSQEDIYTFNYRGGFIQCLKNTSSSEDFKDIITLLENDGNVSTSLIAQRIYYMTDKDIISPQVKYFTAFDIYFSILMVVEKAFP